MKQKGCANRPASHAEPYLGKACGNAGNAKGKRGEGKLSRWGMEVKDYSGTSRKPRPIFAGRRLGKGKTGAAKGERRNPKETVTDRDVLAATSGPAGGGSVGIQS